jgi:hypothetical protein
VRTALKRRTPLRSHGKPMRRVRVRARRGAPRRVGEGVVRDPGYLAEVRLLPCCASEYGKCEAPRQAHHMGDHPMGRKPSDLDAVCLCARHHREWHDATGWCRGWDRATREVFGRAAVAMTRERVERGYIVPDAFADEHT